MGIWGEVGFINRRGGYGREYGFNGRIRDGQKRGKMEDAVKSRRGYVG